ncbi:unnamed protein product [Lampetra planeri]
MFAAFHVVAADFKEDNNVLARPFWALVTSVCQKNSKKVAQQDLCLLCSRSTPEIRFLLDTVQRDIISFQVFHEDGIIYGYRHPHSSATDCVLSLFQLTNETLNIWTHFLPTW